MAEEEPLIVEAHWALREPNTSAFLRACRDVGYSRVIVQHLDGGGVRLCGDFEPLPRPPGVAVSHNIGPRGPRGEPAIWELARQFASGGGAMTMATNQSHMIDLGDLGDRCRVNPGDYMLIADYDLTTTGRMRSSKPNMQNLPRGGRQPEEPLIEEAERALEEIDP